MAEDVKRNWIDPVRYRKATAPMIESARKRKKLQKKQLAAMIGVTERWAWAVGAEKHSIGWELASKIAEALEMPDFMEVVRRERTKTCEVCKLEFVDTTDAMRKEFCSKRCQGTDSQRKTRDYLGQYRDRRVMSLKGEVNMLSFRYGKAKKCIDAYCRSCEPEGLCRAEDCQLREVSPLPLAKTGRVRIA